MTRREAFVAIVLDLTRDGDRAERVLALISSRVDEALAHHWECGSLAEHWREGDTGELRTGSGDDVGECCASCLVDALDRAGLVAVQVLAPCAGGHGWYGDGCPECRPESAA